MRRGPVLAVSSMWIQSQKFPEWHAENPGIILFPISTKEKGINAYFKKDFKWLSRNPCNHNTVIVTPHIQYLQRHGRSSFYPSLGNSIKCHDKTLTRVTNSPVRRCQPTRWMRPCFPSQGLCTLANTSSGITGIWWSAWKHVGRAM